MPLAHVFVEMRHSVGYYHLEPVVVEILIVICDEGDIVLCIVNLQDGDMVLQRVLKVFVC